VAEWNSELVTSLLRVMSALPEGTVKCRLITTGPNGYLIVDDPDQPGYTMGMSLPHGEAGAWRLRLPTPPTGPTPAQP